MFLCCKLTEVNELMRLFKCFILQVHTFRTSKQIKKNIYFGYCRQALGFTLKGKKNDQRQHYNNTKRNDFNIVIQ